MKEEAKEKAIELFNIYKKYYDDEKAKLKTHDMCDRSIDMFQRIFDSTVNPITMRNMIEDIEFYKQVKIELDKL
jgi:hypothetical protein